MFPGYMVIIPDYFDGGMINPMTSPREELGAFVKKQSDWDGKLKLDWEDKIRPYALDHGAKTFGAIGKAALRLSFQYAFTACSCVFKEITLICANQRNYFEDATACSKRLSHFSFKIFP